MGPRRGIQIEGLMGIVEEGGGMVGLGVKQEEELVAGGDGG